MSPGSAYLAHELFDALGVVHGFGQRGAAEPPNHLRPRQVHGAVVMRAEALGGGDPPAADAIVSTRPGLCVAVVTADCLPILVSARSGAAVAAIHAGWRGLAAGVIEAGLDALVAAIPGAAARGQMRAVVGPHIGPCCYEVDAPVLDRLAQRYGGLIDAQLRASRPGHAFLDLGGLALCALERAGLERAQLGSFPDACTRCDARRFHSFRRDGAAAGRMLHFVAAR